MKANGRRGVVLASPLHELERARVIEEDECSPVTIDVDGMRYHERRRHVNEAAGVQSARYSEVLDESDKQPEALV